MTFWLLHVNKVIINSCLQQNKLQGFVKGDESFTCSYFFLCQHTLADLLSKVQASETEILEALKKIEALEVNGKVIYSMSLLIRYE